MKKLFLLMFTIKIQSVPLGTEIQVALQDGITLLGISGGGDFARVLKVGRIAMLLELVRLSDLPVDIDTINAIKKYVWLKETQQILSLEYKNLIKQLLGLGGEVYKWKPEDRPKTKDIVELIQNRFILSVSDQYL